MLMSNEVEQMILEILCWLLASYVFMSFAEYVAHRWVMHKRLRWLPGVFEAHTVMHHGRFYQNFEYDRDPAAKYINVDMDPGRNLLLGMPVWLPLLMLSAVGGATLVCVIFLHAIVWTAIHREMHEPAQRWFAWLWAYRFFRDYHLTHHEHPSANYNVVCPLADFVFRTYRRPGRPPERYLQEP